MSSGLSPTQPTLSSHPIFDELRWVIQIRRTLNDHEIEDDTGIPVFIFNVPKALIASKQEAYIPQQVAIGPYHHWRAELYEMERYKLSTAKRTQRQLQSLKFQDMVDEFMKHEHRIRSYYHRYLDFNGETLAWMMAIDASFLLEFLQILSMKEGKALVGVSSRMSHLIDYTGRKSAYNAILRDIIMLENQIPLFLMKRILELQCKSSEEAEEVLSTILICFLKELSPFKMIENFLHKQVTDRAHLLELLYHIFVPKSEENPEIDETEDENETAKDTEESFANLSPIRKLQSIISSLKGRPFLYLKRALTSRPVKFVLKLPWNILTNLPGFSILKQPVEYFFFSEDRGNIKSEEDESSNRQPLVEEITIPSVSELINAGIRFAVTNGNISTISFDAKCVTFYLPPISLDVNTETILRNLVAFEASSASGPMVCTRYTELMNGIIDTEEDVKLLRKVGIFSNSLKSDGEVADLWNGMSKSVRLTRVAFLDKVIEDVNKYYSSRWKVKMGNFLKKYVFGSWKFLTFLAAIFLLLLTTLQAFCSVYSCGKYKNPR